MTDAPLPHSPDDRLASALPTAGTILLVEDDDQLRSVLRTFLVKHGYRVLEAGVNSSAFMLAGRHEGSIDLMIADLMMPGTTGRDLALRLKAWRPEMKVLYISGQPKEWIERKNLLAPGDAFLLKPFNPYDLLEKVRTLLTAAVLPPRPIEPATPYHSSVVDAPHGTRRFMGVLKRLVEFVKRKPSGIADPDSNDRS